jgi:hypothetical protein
MPQWQNPREEWLVNHVISDGSLSAGSWKESCRRGYLLRQYLHA